MIIQLFNELNNLKKLTHLDQGNHIFKLFRILLLTKIYIIIYNQYKNNMANNIKINVNNYKYIL